MIGGLSPHNFRHYRLKFSGVWTIDVLVISTMLPTAAIFYSIKFHCSPPETQNLTTNT